jgi:VanZ family protein
MIGEGGTRSELRRFGSGLLACAAVYTVFVIYGSLVPFAFEPIAFAEALQRFRAIPMLDLGVGHRADWVANFLLFVPLSLLLYGGLVSRWPGAAAIWLFAVFGFGLALGAGIEFTQIFFPGRTVSLNDLYAQCLGSVVGLASWRPVRAHLWRGYQAWRAPAQGHEKLHLILWLYVVVFLFYNVMPLDLTLSIAEIHEKWKSGRVRLDPFQLGDGTAAEIIYELLTDVLVWVPIAALAMLHLRGRVAPSIVAVVLAALALEFAQLLVYTRVADVRDVLAALLAGTGACFAMRARGPFASVAPAREAVAAPSRGVRLRWLGALLIGWLAVLGVVFGYPFEFTGDPAVAAQRLQSLFRVPLSAYYYGSEYRALTEALRKLLMFMPLGAILAALGASVRITVLIALGVALAIELGQVLLPAKTVDPGDLLFCAIGALVGHMALAHLRSGPRETGIVDAAAIEHEAAGAPRARIRIGAPAISYALLVAAAAIAAASISALPGVPYNVREVIAGDAPGFGDAMLVLAVLLLTVPAVPLAVWLGDGSAWRRVPGLLAALGVLGLLAWLCLHLGVPRESIHDIVGSPILGWPWHWESAARFVALQFPIAVLGLLAACLVQCLAGGGVAVARALRRALTGAIPAWLIAHDIIVRQAATDNLTELMRSGGSVPASLALSTWLLMIFLIAHALAAFLATRRMRPLVAGLVLALASLFGGRALLGLGLADAINKYGQTFSALQFLLSPSREQLLDGGSLAARYAWVQGGLVLALALMLLPAWWSLRRVTDRIVLAPAAARPRRPVTARPAGAYVRMRMTAEEETFLRSQFTQAGLTASQYLTRIAADAAHDAVTRADSHRDKEPHTGTGHAVDIWLEPAVLRSIDARVAAGAGSREAVILALLAAQRVACREW